MDGDILTGAASTRRSATAGALGAAGGDGDKPTRRLLRRACATLPARVPRSGRRAGLVLSGGNIDSRLLAQVINRGLVRSGRIISLRVDITDEPGTLARVATIVGENGGNIIEVRHQRLFLDVPAKAAELDLMVETRDPERMR